MRKSYDELEKIKNELNVKRLWSYSRVEQYCTSHFIYLLKYILNIKADRNDGIYGIMGGLVHDTIERFYNHEIKKEDMLENFKTYWDINVETFGFKFDRNDSAKNDSIKAKYRKCLEHFMVNHDVINEDMLLEQFVLVKVGKEYFQGYLDALKIDKINKIFTIIDWKTSTIFSNKDIPHKSRQLKLYALGLHQQYNIPFENIKICFNFLKYVTVEELQKNGKTKLRNIERNLIGDKLSKSVEKWLKSFGYSEEDIHNYVLKVIAENSIDCLPEEVKEKFNIKDCYLYVDINEDEINLLVSELSDTVNEIKEKEMEYDVTKDPHEFWDNEESLVKNEYYYFNLCDYNLDRVLPFKEYLDKKNAQKEQTDLLGGNKSTKTDEELLKEIFG